MIYALQILNKTFKSIKIDFLLSFGLFKHFYRYFHDRKQYKDQEDVSNWPVAYYPVLADMYAESACLGEYFWQDLFVAKKIINSNPKRHIDIGSRVDGFIAHLACYREVEVFDIRPLSAKIENVKFTQWDITSRQEEFFSIADCVTCLHTLEHIGLGRYGDALDPQGWEIGLKSLAQLLKPDGQLWISVPIGKQRVEWFLAVSSG